MTKEEAVEVLKERYLTCVGIGLDNHANRVNEAIDMAIEALSQPIVAKHFDIQSGYIYCSPQDAENVKFVVRCKDCRHYEDGMVGYCWEVDRGVSGDFFCAYGERREP